MVGIVTGNGLGLTGSSKDTLGLGGQVGASGLGQAGSQVYVNAKTGNLVIQQADELLAGRGLDIGVARTYNSNATFDFDNNDSWQISLYRKLSSFVAGVSIKRTAGDGAEHTYTYVGTVLDIATYRTTAGSGADETLSYNVTSGSGTWTWTDGDSRVTETYQTSPVTGEWRITGNADRDSNTLAYTYNGSGLITQVRTANGETTKLIYTAGTRRLEQIEILTPTGATINNTATTRIVRTYYTYETVAGGLERLKSVKVGLTERNDGSNRYYDTTFYETTYTYHGSTNRIASIVNSDGTGLGTVNAQGVRIGITYYEDGNHIGKVRQIIDTVGQLTEFIYNDNGTTTQIKDPLGRTTTLTYDGNGNLTRVQAPGSQNIRYTYDLNNRGDLMEVTDSRNNKTIYSYDARGNLTRQQDAAGNIIEYTYNDANQRLTQTTHRVLDPDGAGPQQAVLDVVRYAYDSKNHLRFVVSAEGRVTEYEYNAWGQEVISFVYNGGYYNGTAWQQADTTWADALETWTTTQDLTKLQRVDTSYDARGLVTLVKRSSTTNAQGGSLNDATRSFVNYIYDAAGRLLTVVDPLGHAAFSADNNSKNYVTDYLYDGLGRRIKITKYDATGSTPTRDVNGVISGGITTQTEIEYTDTLANGATVTTLLSNGLKRISTYDVRGLLTSQIEQTFGNQALSTVTHQYDALGRLRITTDPLQQKTYFVYDDAGNLTGTIDADGSFVENRYNNNGQIIRTIRYAARANMTTIAGLFAPVSGIVPNVKIGDVGVRPAGTGGVDRHTYFLYDAAGRLAKIIDAAWTVTEYLYNGESQLIETIRYAKPLGSPTQTDAVKAISGEISPDNTNTKPELNAADRRTRSFYSADGLLMGVLDAEGYLIENQYDAAGQRIKTIRYATRITATGNTVDALRPELLTDLSTNTQTERYFYNGQGWLIGHLDAEGYWTRHDYDRAGQRTLSHRYNAPTVNDAALRATGTLTQLIPTGSTSKDLRTETQYDAHGRVIQVTNQPDGTFTLYSYDVVGNLLSITTAANSTAEQRVVTRRYDLQGRLTSELSGEGSEALRLLMLGTHTQADIETLWKYHGTRHTYDAAGRRISTITPSALAGVENLDKRRTVYYYDSDGRMTHRINGLGEVTEYSYDAFGGITKETYYSTRISAGALTGGQTSTLLAMGILVSNSGFDRVLQTSYNMRGGIATTTDAHNVVSWRYYNGFGELDYRVDTNGASNKLTNYYYDRRGQITAMIEDLARAAERGSSVVHDAFGRVVQATDGLNHSRTTGYDRLGRVVETKDATNAVRRIAYDAFGRVLSQTDALNNTTSFSYNSANRSVTMTTAEGISTTTTKNRHGETVTIKDAKNVTTTYSYNKDGQFTQTVQDSGGLNLTTKNRYDAAGQVFQTEDARGTVIQYQYDAVGRVFTRTLDPTGLNLTTTYLYDALGQTAWVRDARGVWIQTTYDKKGQVTLVAVDPASVPNPANFTGLLIANAGALNLRTSYTYDDQGRTLTVVTGFGTPEVRTTQYVYDKFGRRTLEIVNPSGLNLTTKYAYDKADNLVAKTDPRNNVTRYTYDDGNRLVYTVDATGAVTQITHDAEGRLIQSRAYTNRINLSGQPLAMASGVVASLLTAAGNIDSTTFIDTYHAYDKDGRLVVTVDALKYVTTRKYDANNNLVCLTRYANAYTGGLPPDAGTTPTLDATKDQVTRYTYDTADRVVHTVNAGGGVTKNDYNANGQVVKILEYALPITIGGTQLLSAAVDTAVTAVTGQTLRTTYHAYDTAGRLAVTIDALNYVTARKYDANGNLISLTQYSNPYTGTLPPDANSPMPTPDAAKDKATHHAYDKAGRLVVSIDVVDWRNASGVLQQRRYATSRSYDATGNLISLTRYSNVYTGALPPTATSKPIADPEKDQVTHYAYDKAGRLAVTVDALKYVTARKYDANGNLVCLTRYKNPTATLPPTASTAPTSDAKDQVTRYIYDAIGRVVYTVDAEGGVVKHDYNATGQVVKIMEYTLPISIGGAQLTSAAVDTAVSGQTSRTTYHSYDKTGRLAVTIDALKYATSRTYDAYGNLLTQTRHKAPYDDLLTNIPTTLSSDALVDQVTRNTYDKLGRKLTVTTADGRPEAAPTKTTYDAFGNAIIVTDPLGRNGYFWFDALNRNTWQANPEGYVTKTEYGATGLIKMTTRYATRLSGWPLERTTLPPMPTADAEKDQETILTHDALGRLTGLEDALEYVEKTTYDAFGNKETFTNKLYGVFRFTYDKLGRMLSEELPEKVLVDSIAMVVINRYEYDAFGNRTKRIEADGLPISPDGSVIGRTTDWTYDELNRMTKQTGQNSVVHDTVAKNTRMQAPEESRRYDVWGNMIETVDPNGVKVLSYYNALNLKIAEVKPTGDAGILTEYTYDAAGGLTRERRYNNTVAWPGEPGGAPPAASGGYRETNYTLDGNGRITRTEVTGWMWVDGKEVVGALVGGYKDGNYVAEIKTGLATLREYDLNGNVTKETDAPGNRIYRYYDKLGNKIMEVDAARFVTEWKYDANGNITKEARYATALTAEPSKYVLPIPQTSANDRVSDFKYDAMNRVVEEQVQNVAWYDGLDAEGKVKNYTGRVTTLYIRDGLGNITKKTDATNAENDWFYDKQGRLIRHQGAAYDYLDREDGNTLKSVRPTKDLEYNGLGLVRRSIQRGLVNTSETDDRITEYIYGANGYLTGEINPDNVKTTYRNDATGRMTAKWLKRVGDNYEQTEYTYDAAGQQVKQVVSENGGLERNGADLLVYVGEVVQTVDMRYNVHGNLTGKRTYATVAEDWQEEASYDSLGRAWRSNSGDGAIKIYVYDENGNATALMRSEAKDLAAVSYGDLLGRKDSTGENFLQENKSVLLMEYSVFDARNKLVRTFQPPMDGSQVPGTLGQLLTQTSGKKITLSNVNPETHTSTTAASGKANVAVVAGGNVKETMGNYIYGPPYITTSFLFNLPDLSSYGDGDIRIVVSSYTEVLGGPLPPIPWEKLFPAGSRTATVDNIITTWLSSHPYTPTISTTKFITTVYKETKLGSIKISQSTRSTAAEFAEGSVQNSPVAKHIVVRDLPATTESVRIRYRKSDSDKGWTMISLSQMKNSSDAAMDGWFRRDWSNIPIPAGTYDYVLEATAANGRVLSAAEGSMTLSTTAPSMTRTYLPLGDTGAGRVFMGTDHTLYFSQLNSAHTATATIDEIAKTALLRYRQHGTTAWLPADAAIQLPPYGAVDGWFSWNPGLTAGTKYEYLVVVKNGENNTGSVINKIYGTFVAGQANADAVTAPVQTKFFEFSGYPSGATRLELKYRKVGSTGTFIPLTLPANSAGKFVWDPPLDVVGNYDFNYEVFAGNTRLITNAKGTFTVSSTKISASFTFEDEGRTPTILSFPVPQADAVTMVLYYRLGSSGDYLEKTLSRSAGAPTFEWDASDLIPPGGSGTIDYYYNLKKNDGSFVTYRVDPLNPEEQPKPIRVEGRLNVSPTVEAKPSIIPWAVLDIDEASISRQKKFNAFGEIEEEIDGRGYVTTFKYNTLGKLIEKIDPQVNRTLATGMVDVGFTPRTYYSYDRMGRLAAVTDANGNVSRQTMLGDDDSRVAVSTDAYAKNKVYGYDKFGDLRWFRDELGHVTKYSYDKVGRLLDIQRPISGDSYSYDAAGNRVSHTNALGKTETTNYDALGRVTATRSFGGSITRYTYDFKKIAMTINGIVTGTMGIEKHTYLAHGTSDVKHAVEHSDLFDRVTWRQDYSGSRSYDYAYNWTGRLTGQTNTSGQNIVFSYYANGYIRKIHDTALDKRTSYAYDNDGNRIQEHYEYWKDGAWTAAQVSNVVYDKLNRVVAIHDPKADIRYEYDGVGNRRRVWSRYHDGVQGKEAVQDYWYTYDKLNRFVYTMGSLKEGVNGKRERGNGIERGDAGVTIGYDDASRRTSAEYGKNHDVPDTNGFTRAFRETYFYNDDNYLWRTDIDLNLDDTTAGIPRTIRTLDDLGRTVWLEEISSSNTPKLTRWTKYDADSQVEKQKEWTHLAKNAIDLDKNGLLDDTAAPAATRTTENVYALNGTLTSSTQVGDSTTIVTSYTYQWWDQAKQLKIEAQADHEDLPHWAPGFSKFSYDRNGHLKQVDDLANGQAGLGRSLSYITDAQGLILERQELTGGTFVDGEIQNAPHLLLHRFYYHDGHRVGDVGNDGDLKAGTQSYAEQLAWVKPQSIKDKYKFWVPIASADFDQNFQPINRTYPGATASSYTVQAGDTLQSIAAAMWGDASMWYLIADANGLFVNANLVEGQVLTIPNKVTNIHNNAQTFKPYNPETIGDVSPTLPDPPPPPSGGGCGIIGQIIAMIVTVVVAIYAPQMLPELMGAIEGIGGAIAVAATQAAMGSIAGQLVGMALGVQDKFSWAAVATSALSAGLTQGLLGGATTVANGTLSSAGPLGESLQALAKATPLLSTTITRAVIGNVVSQGVSLLTGQQEKFSWASVAGSAVGASVGGSGVTSRLLGSVTTSLLEGRKISWQGIAVNVIGSALGEALGSKMFDDTTQNGQTGAPVEDAVIRDLEKERMISAKQPLGAGNSRSFTPSFTSENMESSLAYDEGWVPEESYGDRNVIYRRDSRLGYGNDSVTISKTQLGKSASSSNIEDKIALDRELAEAKAKFAEVEKNVARLQALDPGGAFNIDVQNRQAVIEELSFTVNGDIRIPSSNSPLITGSVYGDRLLGGSLGLLKTGWDAANGLVRLGGNTVLQVGDMLTFGMNHDDATIQQAWVEQGAMAHSVVRLATELPTVAGEVGDRITANYARANELVGAGDEFGAAVINSNQTSEIASAVGGGASAAKDLFKLGTAAFKGRAHHSLEPDAADGPDLPDGPNVEANRKIIKVQDELKTDHTENRYRVSSKTYPNIGISAYLNNRELSMDIRTYTPDPATGKQIRVEGFEEKPQIEAAFAHFGQRADSVRVSFEADNLASFNRLIVDGHTPESAAMSMTAGKRIQQAGFPNVTFPRQPQGTPGAYTKVELLWTRSGDGHQ